MAEEKRPSLQDYKRDALKHEAEGAKGLECSRCGCRHFRTVKTTPSSRGYVLRRKECRHCGQRQTTVERTLGGADE